MLALVAALVVAAAPNLSARPASHGGETRCASCHTTAGWRDVTFAHDRTGFPLTGRHREAPCQGCHSRGDFGLPVATACFACHRDVHLGRLGARCDGCHDTETWKEQSFGVEAHRRTNFPLTGKHAVVPCEECHADRRDRGYSRVAKRCIGCHELDYGLRATAAGVDHVAAGFGEDCRHCHGVWRFSNAHWPAHDACFQISRGPHSGIACRDCHDAGVPPIPAGGTLGCATDTADCLRCHAMPAIQTRHQAVAGFQPANRRCYECHGFNG